MNPARERCGFLRWVSLLGILAIAEPQVLPCPLGVTNRTVSNTAQAVDLADALLCSGGQFEVTWVGEVLLARTIAVSDGTFLKVSGSSSGGVVIDGGAQTQLFSVSGASTLELQGLSLVNGFSSWDGGAVSDSSPSHGGGAIALLGSSSLGILDCSLDGNTASLGGAMFVDESSTVTIKGDTTLANNNANYGLIGNAGAIYCSSSTLTVEGNTKFANNAAYLGGAIIVSGSSILTMGGNTTFGNNTAYEDGGAIDVTDSTVNIEGDTTFANNTAGLWGGGMFVRESTMNIEGDTTFADNAAYAGGAIYVTDSTVTIEGDTTFADNTAYEDKGGAIYVRGRTLTIVGDTTFTNNTAGRFGGAIYGAASSTVIEGDTTFTGNSAGDGGGALGCEEESHCIINSIHASFSYNSAGGDGGALSCQISDCVIDSVNASFSSNSAGGNGGAISAFGANIAVEGATVMSNTAESGAGGGVYCSSSAASFNETDFIANEAVWGGGLAMFSTGSVWNKDQPETSGPANTTNCVFERNMATDGGGIYSAAGYDIIRDSQFQDNVAAGSGGAYLHSGVAVALERCTFVGNKAFDEGLAVLSLGIAENFSEVVFESNTFYCSSGTYGYDIDISEAEDPETCRFDVVCSRCASSCGETPPTVEVVNITSIPTCQPMVTGVNSTGSAGVTLQTLELEPGYYRTSATSEDILKCHREEACVGGTNSSQYCKAGYQDVYCAVCEEGYGAGYHYSCGSCDDQDKRSVAAVAVVLILAVLLVAAVIADLVDVVNEQDNTASSWNKRLHSCRERIVEAVPLTAVKIVLVTWQILTQFTTVVDVVYPDFYDKFLSVLNLVNFDLGLAPSVSCIFDINFYGRLLFATIAPLIVLGALGLTYAVARSRNRDSPAGLQAAKGKHLSVALFVMFIVYSSVSFVVFQTWACETLDNGVEYLRADYSLVCSTSTHTAWEVYAGLMILVYPVGIPAVFAWWLVSNRRGLVKVGSDNSSDSDRLQPMRDLWAPYKPRRYYYEVVECGRRIMLTGLGVFLFPGSAAQVALEVILAIVFMMISEVLSPFADPMDAWLYRAGTWVVFFSMYLALLLKVDASDENSQSQEIFAKLLIAANAGLILAVVVQVVVSAREGLGVSARDAPVAKENSRRLSFAEVYEGESDDDEHEAAPAWDEVVTTARLPGNT